jgi:hypothetical protein
MNNLSNLMTIASTEWCNYLRSMDDVRIVNGQKISDIALVRWWRACEKVLKEQQKSFYK